MYAAKRFAVELGDDAVICPPDDGFRPFVIYFTQVSISESKPKYFTALM
jgi:hypothetical protein